MAGQVGAYIIRHTDIEQEYKNLFIELFFIIEMCMRKVSIPGDREYIKKNLPVLIIIINVYIDHQYMALRSR